MNKIPQNIIAIKTPTFSPTTPEKLPTQITTATSNLKVAN